MAWVRYAGSILPLMTGFSVQADPGGAGQRARHAHYFPEHRQQRPGNVDHDVAGVRRPQVPTVGRVGPPRTRQRAERDSPEQAADQRDEQRHPPRPPPGSPRRVPTESHAVIVPAPAGTRQVWRYHCRRVSQPHGRAPRSRGLSARCGRSTATRAPREVESLSEPDEPLVQRFPPDRPMIAGRVLLAHADHHIGRLMTTTPMAGRWRSTRRSRSGSGMSSTAAPPTRASSPGHQLQSAPPVAASCGTKYHHAIDIAPTILDTVGVEAPETIRKTQFYSMLGCRGSWHDGWKAVTTQAARAGQPSQPVHLLPRHHRGARGAGSQHQQPLLDDRRAGGRPAPGAEGVLFAHGPRFGGHSLNIKNNRVYDFVGIAGQKIDGTEEVPVGQNLILSPRSTKTGGRPGRWHLQPVSRSSRAATALSRSRYARRGWCTQALHGQQAGGALLRSAS